MNKWLKVTLSAIAILALSIVALGALTLSQSYAQSSTDNDGRANVRERIRSMAQNFGQNRSGSGRGGFNKGGHGHSADMIAEALGITVEELAAAREADKSLADLQEELGIDAETFQANLKTAAIAQVNQKLADGEITQEKADSWIAKIESSDFSMGGRGFGKGDGRRGHGKGFGHSADMVAEALGITVDELAAAREADKSLADLQEELGIDAETFQANLKTAAIAQVNQKLADGEITQEKADSWIAKIESSDFSMGGRGSGKGRGHRGHHDGDKDKSDTDESDTEESDTGIDDGDETEESADTDGTGNVASTEPLFRVVNDVQAGDMSLYLPMMTTGNN